MKNFLKTQLNGLTLKKVLSIYVISGLVSLLMHIVFGIIIFPNSNVVGTAIGMTFTFIVYSILFIPILWILTKKSRSPNMFKAITVLSILSLLASFAYIVVSTPYEISMERKLNDVKQEAYLIVDQLEEYRESVGEYPLNISSVLGEERPFIATGRYNYSTKNKDAIRQITFIRHDNTTMISYIWENGDVEYEYSKSDTKDNFFLVFQINDRFRDFIYDKDKKEFFGFEP